MRADVDLQGTVTAKDLLTQATLVAEKRVVADILGSLNHCNRKKRHVQFLYHSASISWQNYLLFPSSHFLFYPFQCNKIHSKWCLVSSYLLLETITFTNDGRGGAGIRELCPFVTHFFFPPELYLQGIPKIWPSCLFKSREMQFILTSKWII